MITAPLKALVVNAKNAGPAALLVVTPIIVAPVVTTLAPLQVVRPAPLVTIISQLQMSSNSDDVGAAGR